MREVDGLSLLFVNLNIPALTPRLHCGKTALEISKVIILFAISVECNKHVSSANRAK
jgi:hypothetical protein